LESVWLFMHKMGIDGGLYAATIDLVLVSRTTTTPFTASCTAFLVSSACNSNVECRNDNLARVCALAGPSMLHPCLPPQDKGLKSIRESAVGFLLRLVSQYNILILPCLMLCHAFRRRIACSHVSWTHSLPSSSALVDFKTSYLEGAPWPRWYTYERAFDHDNVKEVS